MLGGVFLMISNLTVPVLNRYDLLVQMLDSIDYPVKHLLIIDNSGKLEYVPQPEPVDKLTVWNMPANFGVAASWNLGIKAFRNDDVFFFASNDMRFQPGGLKALGRAERDAVTLSHQMPYFHTFAVGVDVVARVGLFDESFFPAYCEDIDYLWRCEREGITVNRVVIPTSHDNSSTIGSDLNYQSANTVTYPQNAELLKWKQNNMKAEALPFNVMRWRRQDWR
jgi:GT2 family glycosyltransferase